MRKFLSIVFIAAIILFALDRLVSHLYLPKDNATAVVIYTTEWCPYCKALRKTLQQYSIPYTEYDTEKSLHGLAGYWALGGHGVPISVIGEEVLHGYDGQVITDALVAAGYTIPDNWTDEETQ